MDAFQIRLIHEAKQLQSRFGKLKQFTTTEKFDTLPENVQKQLNEQLAGMDKYGEALFDRMATLGIPRDELTPGQKAMGVNFNPSKLNLVEDIKDKAAELADLIMAARAEVHKDIYAAPEQRDNTGEILAMYTLAIRKLQEGQMWAVKAATWQH